MPIVIEMPDGEAAKTLAVVEEVVAVGATPAASSGAT